MEIVEKAQELHMAFAPVQNTEDLLNDPQMKARGFFVEIDHPVAGSWRYPGIPWVMTECESRLSRAPLLGEHNEEILCGRLGLSKADLVSLRAGGCI
jgi:formyl-CoA transferase